MVQWCSWLDLARTKLHSRAFTRRRYPLWRLVRANFYDFVLLLRESWVVLVGFLIVVFTARCT